MKKKTLLPFVLKMMAMLFTTLLIWVWWDSDARLIFLLSSLFFITVPIVATSLVIFILSLRLRDWRQRTLFAAGILNVLLLLLLPRFMGCDAGKMAAFYEDHRPALDEFCRYVHHAVAPGASLRLEFEADTICIFHVSAPGDSLLSQHWDDAQARQDSLRAVVGLTAGELAGIRQRLHELGCLSVSCSSDHPGRTEVGFRRRGFGLYSFVLHHPPMSAGEYQAYLDNISTVPYDRHVAFVYYAGAVGNLDFPGKEEWLSARRAGPGNH